MEANLIEENCLLFSMKMEYPSKDREDTSFYRERHLKDSFVSAQETIIMPPLFQWMNSLNLPLNMMMQLQS